MTSLATIIHTADIFPHGILITALLLILPLIWSGNDEPEIPDTRAIRIVRLVFKIVVTIAVFAAIVLLIIDSRH